MERMGDGAVLLFDMTVEAVLEETRSGGTDDGLGSVRTERIEHDDIVGDLAHGGQAAADVALLVEGDDNDRKPAHGRKLCEFHSSAAA